MAAALNRSVARTMQHGAVSSTVRGMQGRLLGVPGQQRTCRHFSSNTRDPTTTHVIPRYWSDNLVPRRVRNTIASCMCDPEGWDTTLVKGAAVKYSDSAALRLRRRAMLRWSESGPSTALIIKKPGVPEASAKLLEIAKWLSAQGIKPLVEPTVHATEARHLDPFDHQHDTVDFAVTLGGDGTVLHLASLFEADTPLPPILAFAMGTLGFLTPFDANEFAHCLTRVLNSTQRPLFCTLRTRKRCELRHEGRVLCVHNVLNEVAIDRGAFSGAVSLELFVDGHFITNVEADGLIVATPSGSTAYSMSAGGPMVAPSVPCTIITPVAPMSLSFRPLVIPESSDIVVHLPSYARSVARCSFDGKNAIRMRKDTSLAVTTSLCPLPMINLGVLDSDWYDGITGKLKWNQSIRQPPKLPDYYRAQIPPGMYSSGTNGGGYAGNGTGFSGPYRFPAPGAAGYPPAGSGPPAGSPGVQPYLDDLTEYSNYP